LERDRVCHHRDVADLCAIGGRTTRTDLGVGIDPARRYVERPGAVNRRRTGMSAVGVESTETDLGISPVAASTDHIYRTASRGSAGDGIEVNKDASIDRPGHSVAPAADLSKRLRAGSSIYIYSVESG